MKEPNLKVGGDLHKEPKNIHREHRIEGSLFIILWSILCLLAAIGIVGVLKLAEKFNF